VLWTDGITVLGKLFLFACVSLLFACVLHSSKSKPTGFAQVDFENARATFFYRLGQSTSGFEIQRGRKAMIQVQNMRQTVLHLRELARDSELPGYAEMLNNEADDVEMRAIELAIMPQTRSCDSLDQMSAQDHVPADIEATHDVRLAAIARQIFS